MGEEKVPAGRGESTVEEQKASLVEPLILKMLEIKPVKAAGLRDMFEEFGLRGCWPKDMARVAKLIPSRQPEIAGPSRFTET
jgi:hypothetical protein